MSIWWIIIGVIAVAFLWNKIMGDDKTRLFRRVWSTERLMSSSPMEMSQKQGDAINTLVKTFGIVDNGNKDALRKSIAELCNAAMTFDMKNPRNSGIEVTPVIIRALYSRFPNIEDE